MKFFNSIKLVCAYKMLTACTFLKWRFNILVLKHCKKDLKNKSIF